MGKRPRPPHYITGFGDGDVKSHDENAAYPSIGDYINKISVKNNNIRNNNNNNNNNNNSYNSYNQNNNINRDYHPFLRHTQYLRGKPVTIAAPLLSESADPFSSSSVHHHHHPPPPHGGGGGGTTPAMWQYSAMALIASMGLFLFLFLFFINDAHPMTTTTTTTTATTAASSSSAAPSSSIFSRRRRNQHHRRRDPEKKKKTDEWSDDCESDEYRADNETVYFPPQPAAGYPVKHRRPHHNNNNHMLTEHPSPVYRSPSNSFQQSQPPHPTLPPPSPYREQPPPLPPPQHPGLDGFQQQQPRSSLNASRLSPVSSFPSLSEHSGHADTTSTRLPLPPGVTRGEPQQQQQQQLLPTTWSSSSSRRLHPGVGMDILGDDTPLAGSRRAVVQGITPLLGTTPQKISIPFMPEITAVPPPPESFVVGELMEPGQLSATPSFAKPPLPKQLLQANNNDEEEEEDPKEDHNDPRNNIHRKRANLTTDTDTSSSLGNIVFSDLQLIEVIGGGGFGQVWKAMWMWTPVAVKVLTGQAQRKNVSRAILEEFTAEINMLKGMHHPNICLYVGACVDPPNRAIVTELMANGSLWDALRLPLKQPYSELDGTRPWPAELYPYGLRSIPPRGAWPWNLVKRVAYGSARGMVYLHNGSPPVLHRDLKSANLLLDESYTAKVCDFGLSRLKAQERSMTGNCGTVQWMAPEILANEAYAEPADVFSYGVILWELLTKECPYDGMTPIQCAIAVLKNGKRPKIPEWCPPAFRSLMEWCFRREPNARPTFSQIIAALDAMP